MCNHQHDIWVSIPIGNALHQNYKVAMSLKELVRETNDFSKKDKEGNPRTAGCVATLKESNPQEMFLRYNVKCSLKGSDASGHDVKVRFDYWNINERSSVDNLDMECSCSCPAFLYWGAQWNLHQKDSLEGDPRPALVAPTEKLEWRGGYLICKHIKVVLDRVIPSVARVINDIKRKKHVEQFKLQEEVEERRKNRKNKPVPGEGGVDPVVRKKPSKPKPGPAEDIEDEVPETSPKVKSYPGVKKDPEAPAVEPEPTETKKIPKIKTPEPEEEEIPTRTRKIVPKRPSRSGVID